MFMAKACVLAICQFLPLKLYWFVCFALTALHQIVIACDGTRSPVDGLSRSQLCWTLCYFTLMGNRWSKSKLCLWQRRARCAGYLPISSAKVVLVLSALL